jgi:hypothetical protein
MNEYYIGYLENMKALMEKSAGATHERNEESGGELAKGNQNVSSLYVLYIELYQKLANQWIDTFWRPFILGAQAQQASTMS